MPFTLGHNVQPQNLFVEAGHHPCYQMVAVQATPSESSPSTNIIVLEALLEAERDGVAAMNELISILKLEIMQLAARIMQATQELEEVRMLHLKTEEVLLLLLSEAQGNPSSSLDSS